MVTRVLSKPREPLWSRVFGSLVTLLLINLLWNEPFGPMTDNAWGAFVLLNLLPSALAIFLIFRDGRR